MLSQEIKTIFSILIEETDWISEKFANFFNLW